MRRDRGQMHSDSSLAGCHGPFVYVGTCHHYSLRVLLNRMSLHEKINCLDVMSAAFLFIFFV